ncbi:hypothetical protein CROQUDRAFT_660286 [Cronartium quercuum f. sp. fusiforme G11]|uniref:NADPH-dependent diflavin oxidoreductase 1 n=1 Tax=Cronartium quercuum f. sp. fusiforme G11 TaxID=708437 RepID=A0A9P6T9K7_9BASI|nr:hypothetical protein CROQUDRAFT_660286 [Cronartium quercuum f. sp. fusiforme G11]
MSTQTPTRRLLILYGSQTGTAEDVANQIALGARRLHLDTTISAMDECEPQSLFEDTYTIFVLSTTGQGSEPQNMKKIWKSICQAKLPLDLFQSLKFTIFGLGDSNYSKFNWAAKKLYRRLIQLGAIEFYSRGEADDQNPNGIDTTLIPWLASLWPTLLELMPLPLGLTILPDTDLLPARFTLKPCEHAQVSSSAALPVFSPTIATLSMNRRLTPIEHWQDTRHLEFDFGEDLNFLPGSVASLMPENHPDDVSRFLSLMKWDGIADQLFQWSSAIKGQPLLAPLAAPITLRQLFTTYFDILSVPKKSFINWLSYFTTNPDHTERLKEFCSFDGQDDLYDYINRPRRTILEVLSDFKSVSIPLDYIPDIFPRIRPRQFSIASSSKMFPRQIHLLVAVVNYRTRISTPRKGLCTSWLARLKPGSRVPVRIEPGWFKFPSDPNKAVICVGPGTGIAPFRSLIQERSIQDSKKMNHLIIYGCRNRDKDFYYRNEWEEFESRGICKFHSAASRDQERKHYVQHEIEKHADEVWELMSKQEASIYISGSAGQMPKAVRKALKGVCLSQGKMKEEEGKVDEHIEMLDRTGRLQEETWS